jgi:hypothetical protein
MALKAAGHFFGLARSEPCRFEKDIPGRIPRILFVVILVLDTIGVYADPRGPA